MKGVEKRKESDEFGFEPIGRIAFRVLDGLMAKKEEGLVTQGVKKTSPTPTLY
ncbi:hypothetical protein [Bartonella australis]|uniref:hypothetical protein n=1 Tax=Bartonella australis TaxID=388640 RepID=UPI00034CF119|nr:hypothetical protein [Bartonella australis]